MRKIGFFIGVVLTSFLAIFALTFTQKAYAAETGFLWIDPDVDMIQGWGWMTGANVVITIGEDEFPITAGDLGNFVLNLKGTGYDISADSEVTATHAGQTTSHTVTSLAFNPDFNYPTDTDIKGTAAPNSTVIIWLSDFGQGGRKWNDSFTVTTNAQGEWTVTDNAGWTSLGLTNLEYKDVHVFQPLTEDVVNYQHQDGPQSGNATFVKKSMDPGSIILGIYPQINTIYGHSWPYGTLTASILKGTESLTYNHGIHSGGDFRINYDDHRTNLEVGDSVTAKIGEFSLTHEILDLEISSRDTNANTVSGKGLANSSVIVGLGDDNMAPDARRTITTDSNGNWVADFSVEVDDGGFGWGSTYNLTSETEVWAYQNIAVPELEAELGTVELRTYVTDRTTLITLVRDFITTRMAEFAALQTNISAVLDDPSQQLVFESPDLGKISFSTFDIDTLLVINPEYLESLEEFVTMSYDSENNTLSSKVETSTLEFLSGHSATIQFFNVVENLGVTGITTENVRDYIDIKVYDDGVLVTNLSEYFDWDNVTYNAETDTLTLPVNHFTEYVLGASSELPETGMGVIYLVSFGILSLITGSVIVKKQKFLN